MTAQSQTLVKLEDLVPEEAEFTLSKTGKTYTLKPAPISEWAWMQRKFGAELNDVLQGKNWSQVCQVVFRLLSTTDKEDFIARDCTYFNEDTGEKTMGRIGGAPLLEHEISGIPEFIEILRAMLVSLGAGQPLRKAEAEDSKKKDQKLKSAGEKSST